MHSALLLSSPEIAPQTVGEADSKVAKVKRSASSAPVALYPKKACHEERSHDAKKKCSSCAKWKLLQEFTGRATCDACLTRKRLKAAAKVSSKAANASVEKAVHIS